MGHSLIISSFSFLLAIVRLDRWSFAGGEIRTGDLWCRKRPLCQLRHNHFLSFIGSRNKFFPVPSSFWSFWVLLKDEFERFLAVKLFNGTLKLKNGEIASKWKKCFHDLLKPPSLKLAMKKDIKHSFGAFLGTKNPFATTTPPPLSPPPLLYDPSFGQAVNVFSMFFAMMLIFEEKLHWFLQPLSTLLFMVC